MTATQVLAIVVGTLVLDRVITHLQSRLLYWRFSRSFRRAQRRMAECDHPAAEIATFNFGSDDAPLPGEQCRRCLAMRTRGGSWSARTLALGKDICP